MDSGESADPALSEQEHDIPHAEALGRMPETPQKNGVRGRGKPKSRRGRKPGSSTADSDTKLYLDWKAAHRQNGLTKAEFIHERRLPSSALAALERGRANEKRKRNKRKRSFGRNSLDESSQDLSN
jgi:hypothetical protein